MVISKERHEGMEAAKPKSSVSLTRHITSALLSNETCWRRVRCGKEKATLNNSSESTNDASPILHSHKANKSSVAANVGQFDYFFENESKLSGKEIDSLMIRIR